MKLRLLALLAFSLVALASGCRRAEPAAETNTATDSHLLRGTVVEIRAASSVLVVKHETIPGFMTAMTMPFHADAATLQSVAPGQAITATLFQKDGDLWLRDVKPAPR